MAVLNFTHQQPNAFGYLDISIPQGLGNFYGDQHVLVIYPSAMVQQLYIEAGFVNKNGSINNDRQMGAVGQGILDTLGKAASIAISPPGLPPGTIRGLAVDRIRSYMADAVTDRTTIPAILSVMGMYLPGSFCIAMLLVKRKDQKPKLIAAVNNPDHTLAKFPAQQWRQLTATHGTLGYEKTSVNVWSV
jgi:hypothetical protein